jgi:hypothetical protein
VKKLLLVVMALAFAVGLGAPACSSGDDSAADAGTDPDTATDTDAGVDTDCGEVDETCCGNQPYCAEDQISVTTDGEDCWCYTECTLAMCEDADETWASDVACQDVGSGFGACMAAEDLVTGQDCEVGGACTTISGYEGICLSDTTNEYCLATCTPLADTGCDIVHTCQSLVNFLTGEFAGAACIPK